MQQSDFVSCEYDWSERDADTFKTKDSALNRFIRIRKWIWARRILSHRCKLEWFDLGYRNCCIVDLFIWILYALIWIWWLSPKFSLVFWHFKWIILGKYKSFVKNTLMNLKKTSNSVWKLHENDQYSGNSPFNDPP